MNYRIQTFTSRQKGKIYTYQWFGYSCRDKVTRKPAFKCLVHLTGLPEDVLDKFRKLVDSGLDLDMEHGDVRDSYKSMDGFHVFVTDKLDVTADETREEYRGLQQVEQTFRTMKGTELFIRPVRLWNPERVKAHVFVCMLVYRVIWKAGRVFREFEKPEGDLHVSLRHIWEMPGQVEIGRLKIGEDLQEQFAPVGKEVKAILKAAGVSVSTLAQTYLKSVM